MKGEGKRDMSRPICEYGSGARGMRPRDALVRCSSRQKPGSCMYMYMRIYMWVYMCIFVYMTVTRMCK